jgi:hypothetical protein
MLKLSTHQTQSLDLRTPGLSGKLLDHLMALVHTKAGNRSMEPENLPDVALPWQMAIKVERLIP